MMATRTPSSDSEESKSNDGGTRSTRSESSKPDQSFYTDAAKYWEGIPSTVNGVMGGLGKISSKDVAGSRKFILPFIQGPEATVNPNRALDCGAGIGRISKRLLIPLFSQVDLVEQNPAFLEQAKTYLGDRSDKVGAYYPVGLQEFTPQEGHYDVIWNQWVLSHLTDDDLVLYFRRCLKGLTPDDEGLIVAKENIASDDGDVPDEEDSSVTRCRDSFLRVFERAGLKVVREVDQEGFPPDLFKVTMFALR